jgi:catechol 2,3-dioxygenase-like lactoylglutathione lyase family enzyme
MAGLRDARPAGDPQKNNLRNQLGVAMIDHINAYALTVRDVRTCAEFYRDKLGFKLEELQDGFAYLTFGDGHAAGVALISAAGLAQEIPQARVRPDEAVPGRNYFATFLTDADRAYEELSRKGVRFLQPPATRPNGQRYAFFEDPEGNLWEISHFPKGEVVPPA